MAALLGQQIAELDTRIKDIEAKLVSALRHHHRGGCRMIGVVLT